MCRPDSFCRWRARLLEAEILLNDRQLDTAASILSENISEPQAVPDLRARHSMLLGELYIGRGQLQDAERELGKAKQLALSADDPTTPARTAAVKNVVNLLALVRRRREALRNAPAFAAASAQRSLRGARRGRSGRCRNRRSWTGKARWTGWLLDIQDGCGMQSKKKRFQAIPNCISGGPPELHRQPAQ